MSTVTGARQILSGDAPVSSLDAYLALGGGEGLRAALQLQPAEVIEEVARSGLQGRGGAGFPAGLKWRSVAGHAGRTRYVVCNAAEGEPGTYKDRWLLRHNPYQVLEGLAIAGHAVGAVGAFVALKASFHDEVTLVERALAEMREADLLAGVPVEVVAGPEDYLFGEEKALLEVVEGRLPLPRVLPPYQVGLFASRGAPNPTVMNNAETLAHVAHIMRNGPDWFRGHGTTSSPGTMLFTVCGDVRHPGVYELDLGVPLRTLVEQCGGGPPEGRAVKAIVPGASSGLLTADQLDVPLAFDAMADAGSGLGSAGFVVYDDSACMVAATAAFSGFLAAESCGQCPACKQGTLKITECLARLEAGQGTQDDLDTLRSRCRSVTGGSRCALPMGEAALVSSALDAFEAEFAAHVDAGCPTPRDLPVPKLVADTDHPGAFVYAEQAPGAPPAPGQEEASSG